MNDEAIESVEVVSTLDSFFTGSKPVGSAGTDYSSPEIDDVAPVFNGVR